MAFREFETFVFSRRSLLRGSATLAAGAALSGSPFAAFARAVQPTGWGHVQGLIDDYVDNGKLANVVAVMGWGQSQPQMLAKGPQTVGLALPAGMDSLFRIYSMTKPITGMAAMMLIDDGKLGLDQPIAEILPKYAKMTVQKTYDGSLTDVVPAERPITVRQLLTHTSGLGYNIIQKGPIRKAYAAAGILGGQVSHLPLAEAIFGKSTPAPSLAAFADRLAELPLVYQPGTKWSYSYALDLLGRVIEVASGQPFDVFLAERLFKPAGMDSTWFTVPDSEASRLTSNYGVIEGALVPLDPARSSIFLSKVAYPMGGGGLVSSPRDYDRFLQMLAGYGKIEGKRVMGELAVRVGTSNLLPDGVSTEGSFASGSGFGAGGGVGLGAQAGQFGWAGAAGTVAAVDMKRGLRASMFTQYMPSDAYPLHRAFPQAVAADLKAMAAS